VPGESGRCDGIDDVLLNGEVDHRVVIEDLPEAAADVRATRVPGQVAACAGPQGVYHGPVIRVGGQYDDRGSWRMANGG
jgi:hypothetical protein